MRHQTWVLPAVALLALAVAGETVVAETPAESAPQEPAVEERSGEPPLDDDAPSAPPAGWFTDLRDTVTSDMSRFYRRRRAMRFGGVLAGAGVLANTDGDEEVQTWYREDVRTASGDEWAADLERLGRMETVGLPLLAGGLLVGLAPREGAAPPIRWLRGTARAYVVGTPALLYLQPLTGGNRPAEGLGSDWQPFVGQNGVSGHAFVGAVPFLTLARQTDRSWLRVLAVVASTAGGWAQFHVDQHYLSQFALGWWLAWEATDAIAESDARLLGEGEEPRVAVLPVAAEGGGGVLVSVRF
ncbi:MAG TPA: hypothetical protein VHM02_08725 [Thermoanaerobaculia bacterium]|nr:hypothetical protein [Thermoanaerobaculia bacterium]